MMRMVMVIVMLAAIGVVLVQLRRSELTVRHEIQNLQMRQVSLRRTLWDQQVRLGYMTTPDEVRRRALGEYPVDATSGPARPQR